MKATNFLRCLVLAAATTFTAASFAQNAISISPATLHVDGLVTDYDIACDAQIFNSGTSDVNITWARENVNVPAAWATAVCDPVTCYGPGTSGKNFTQSPNTASTGSNLLMHFYPNNTQGSGSAEIALYAQGTHTEFARGHFSATAAVVGTVAYTEMDAQLYPNPTSANLTLLYAPNVAAIRMYNLIGGLVKAFPATTDNTYSVAELPRGVYMVQLLDKNGSALTTVRVVKSN